MNQNKSRLRTALLSVAAVVALTGTPVQVTASSEECSSTVISESTTIRIAEDYELAGCRILVAGTIEAAAGSGANIHLEAEREIVVSGVLLAGDGLTGSDTSAEGLATGGAGRPGGSVILKAGCASSPCTGHVELQQDAVVMSGSGGNGGHASASGAGLDCQCAEGGDGARAGVVVFRGATVAIDGEARAGRGGSGGDAYARGHHASAQGGAGGSSGAVWSSTWNLTQILLRNMGSLAGPGGIATAFAAPTVCDVVNNVCGQPGDPDVKGCVEAIYLPVGGPLFLPGGPYDATASGGPGGFGIFKGGQGGWAEAGGCENPGVGTKGQDGADGSGPAVAYTPPTGGGGADPGPTGGHGTATGGPGGEGLALGGDGGDASATGGKGGKGGTGGRGGNHGTFAAPCLDGTNGGAGADGGLGGTGAATGGNAGDYWISVPPALEIFGTGVPGFGKGAPGTGGTLGEGGPPGSPTGPAGVSGVQVCSGTPGNKGPDGENGDPGGSSSNPGQPGSSSRRDLKDVLKDIECWATGC